MPTSQPATAGTPIRVTIGDTVLTGRLWDNATARDLIAQLPLTLTFRDFKGVEKTAQLRRKLSMDGVPAGVTRYVVFRRRYVMRGTVFYSPWDVRSEQRPDPTIIEPTDAIIRLSATCVCGSDLWPYRGVDPVTEPVPMGHEYVGVVEVVGSAVKAVKLGQFVVGSFLASDNTCEICRAGYQSSCVHRQPSAPTGAQAEYARIPLADGTLVATPDLPPADLLPSLLAASDVFGTGWFGAVAAAVGLCVVLAA